MRAVATILVAAIGVAGCGAGVDGGSARRSAAGLAPLVVDPPPGWCASEYDMDAREDGKRSLTVVAPDAQANVIASTEPLDRGIDTEEYAASQLVLLEDEMPRFEMLASRDSEAFGGGHLREFRWTPPDGVEVWQVQAYRAEHGVGMVATGTTTATAERRVRSVLRREVERVRAVDPSQAKRPAGCDP